MGNQQDVRIKCNLLLIGKTGAGKSSFANYLFRVDKFTTGTGAPVTKWEENFQQYFLNVGNSSNTPVAQVNVYDSVGLEPNNIDKWMSKLDQFLSEKQRKNTSIVSSAAVLAGIPIVPILLKIPGFGKAGITGGLEAVSLVPPANEIMHICFYVINGDTGRIEPNELSIINKICQGHKLPVSVIITNCDVASESQLTGIEKVAKNKGLESIRVCSVSRKTRGNEKKEPFGREAAIKKVLSASYEKVGKELSIIVFKQLIIFLRDLKDTFIKKIDDSDISIFKVDEMDNSFKKIMDDMEKLLGKFNDPKDLLPPAYINYGNFVDNFDVDYQGRDIYEESFEEVRNVLGNFDMNNLNFGKKINKAMENMEGGNIFQKIGSIVTIGGTALFIKSSIKQMVAEGFELVINRLNSQLEKIKRS